MIWACINPLCWHTPWQTIYKDGIFLSICADIHRLNLLAAIQMKDCKWKQQKQSTSEESVGCFGSDAKCGSCLPVDCWIWQDVGQTNMSLQIKLEKTQKSIVSSIDTSSSVPSFCLSVGLPCSFQCSYLPFFPQRRTGSVCFYACVWDGKSRCVHVCRNV